MNLQLEQLKNGLEASKTMRDDLLAIAVIQASIINAETQQARTRMRLITQINTVEKQFNEQVHKEKMEQLSVQLDQEQLVAKRGLATIETVSKSKVIFERRAATEISKVDSRLAMQFKESAIGQA